MTATLAAWSERAAIDAASIDARRTDTMGIHPEFNPSGPQAALAMIRAALGHMFPLNAVRIVSSDRIAIEDNDGDDWDLELRAPSREG
jgi:hypothetical protein